MPTANTNGLRENEYFEEDEEDLLDVQLPLVCCESRHIGKIEGSSMVTQTWRMKERVINLFISCIL